MTAQLRCRYCSKSIPNRRHEALCAKRPGRPQGASRKGSARKKPHAEPVGLVEQAENDSAAGEAFIVGDSEPEAAEDSMPDFSDGTPMFTEPTLGTRPEPAPAPQAAAPTPPPIQDSALWESVVSFICDGVDAAVKGTVGDVPATPQPPQSIPAEKRKQLAEAIGAAVAAYGGGAAQLLGKWGPAINLAFVAGSIFLPTIMQARAFIAWKQGEERKARDDAARARAIGSGPLAAAGKAPQAAEDEFEVIARRLAERQAQIERDGEQSRRLL